MFERLARLADRRAKRVLIVAAVVFVVAGVLGAGVADRLDPYGADDPDTESVIADEQLRGRRATARPTSSSSSRRRPAPPPGASGSPSSSARSMPTEPSPTVAGFERTGSKAFVSHDGDATYLAVALKPTDDDASQEAAERIAASLEGERGVSVGGTALAQAAGQRAGRVGPAPRRAVRLPAPLPALAALLPQPGRRAAAAARRRARDRRHVLDAERRQRGHLGLDLRPQPGHRARARAGDRLQPVHRLALPRGDRAKPAPASRRCGGRWRPPGAPCCSAR